LTTNNSTTNDDHEQTRFYFKLTIMIITNFEWLVACQKICFIFLFRSFVRPFIFIELLVAL